METRADIKRRIRLGLGETINSPGWSEPLLLDEIVIEATNQVARECDAYWTYFDFDLAGTAATPQGAVCLPKSDYGEIYKIKSARVYDGSRYTLLREGRDIVTGAWMDHNRPEWRENPASSDKPEFLVLTRPDLLLYPLCTITQTDGLRIYGFATPGRLWDPASEAISDADEFPLPFWALEAVETLAKYKRCLQFPNPDNKWRAKELHELYYDELRPDVEHKAAQEYGRASL